MENVLYAYLKEQNDGVDRKQEVERALQAVAYVIATNFPAAESTAKDDVFSIGLKVTFDRSQEPTTVKAVSRCTKASIKEITLECESED